MYSHLCVMLLTALGGLTGPAADPPASGPPYLGVGVGPGPGGAAGVEVREVAPGGPAEKAGLQVGDRVARVGDQDVRDVDAFLKAVAAKKPSGQKSNSVPHQWHREDAMASPQYELTDGQRRRVFASVVGCRAAGSPPAAYRPALAERYELTVRQMVAIETEGDEREWGPLEFRSPTDG